MQHAVTHPHPPFRVAVDTAGTLLEVHQIPVWRDNFSWLVRCLASGEVAVVDGPEYAPVRAHLEAQALTLDTVLTTHTHPDHIGIHRDLAGANALAELRVVGNPKADIPGRNEAVEDGDPVRLGAATGRALLTEGHIDHHISYLFGPLLFCGDTLFAGGCGYLFDGPPAKMHASLERLAALPDDTLICCAHEYTEDNLRFAWSVEPDNQALADRIRRVTEQRDRGESTVPSTMAEERATNPFLRGHSPTIRASLRRALPDAPIETPAEVFAATRALKDRKDYTRSGDT